MVGPRRRTQRRRLGGQRLAGDPSEAFPQLIGGGEAEVADLVEGGDASFASRALSHEQHPHGLDEAVAALGHPPGPAAQRRSARLHRVAGVELAVAPAGLAVGTVHLDHLGPRRAQVAGQAGTVSARSLHAHPGDGAELEQPGPQLAVASRVGGERLDAQHPAVGVECRGHVHVEVSVNTAGDRARLYDGHRHPFSLNRSRGGTHVPGRRPCRSGCCEQPDRHPPERGVPRTSREPVDEHFNPSVRDPSQIDTREPEKVPTSVLTAVDAPLPQCRD